MKNAAKMKQLQNVATFKNTKIKAKLKKKAIYVCKSKIICNFASHFNG